MATRQVNIRLPEEEALILDTAVFVDGLSSIAEVLRPAIAQLVSRLRDNPDIQAALRIRVERTAVADGKLSRLSERRRTVEGA
jgi:hypothetical protein